MEPLADLCGERLLRDEVGVALEGTRDRPLVPQRDAIGDLESRFLAQIVQMVGELARETLELELRRELGLERDGSTRLAAHSVTRRTLVGAQDLRVFTPAADRAARPSSTTRRAARIRRSRSSSIRSGCSSGYAVRCTDASALGDACRTAPSYMSSARNGVTGASSRISVVSASYS